MSDRIVLSGPGDVVASVPSLLGFHPERSLVALWVGDTGHTLICTQRLDLDHPTPGVCRMLLDAAARTGSTRVILLAYPARLVDWIDSPHEAMLLEVATTLSDAGITVADTLLVTQGRFHSLMCTDPGCCPIQGRPVPAGTSVVEADRVAGGFPAVARSRQAVTDRYRFRPQHTPTAALLHDAAGVVPTDPGTGCPRAVTALRQVQELPPGPHRDRVRAELMWLLQDVTIRDYLLAHLAADIPDHAGVETLVQLALSAPVDLRPRLAGAAAAALYACADSSVAVWALIEHAAEDSLAALVADALTMCVPPSVLADCFAQARDLITPQLGTPQPGTSTDTPTQNP